MQPGPRACHSHTTREAAATMAVAAAAPRHMINGDAEAACLPTAAVATVAVAATAATE